MTPKSFTLEEANSLVPAISQVFGKIMALRVKMNLIREALDYSGQAKLEFQEPPEKLNEKMSILAEELKKHASEIQSYGCFVKDLDHCLVDFFTVVDNKPLFLCWKYGEDKISYWHDTQSGARDRQPISMILQEVRRF